jgi:stage V sporulation protein G
MEITEVRIKLMEDSDDRLQAFCSITFDNSFVVRDLKIIDGANGPFVAMPSRKLTNHCHQCGTKNHLKAQYCNQCGSRQREDRTVRDSEGRAKLYADIAHPINSSCREMIQNRVITEFRTEKERAMQPGYKSRYDDEYDDDIDAATLLPPEETKPVRPPLPAGTQVQPAQTQPPPPHILPAPQPAKGPAGSGGPASSGPASSGPPSGGSAGGPHFGQAPSQRDAGQRESAAREESGDKPAAPNPPPKQRPKGDFGAGIF